jgi:hypothetical protein
MVLCGKSFIKKLQKLDNNTFLIGQDGWADGRLA